MSARGAFVIVAAAVLAAVLFTAVVTPAIDRGGVAELALVVVAFAAILLVERWLRGR